MKLRVHWQREHVHRSYRSSEKRLFCTKSQRSIRNLSYQNKKVGIIENGTWAPTAAKVMKDLISTMKNIELCENIVTIKSRCVTVKFNKIPEEELHNKLIQCIDPNPNKEEAISFVKSIYKSEI